MPDSRARPQPSRLLVSILILVIVAAVALAGLRMARSFPRDSHLGYTEGTWVALAIDTAHGVFYRPLEGPLGYGGIRYFALFFTLHAVLIRLGVGAITAGYAIAVASGALLLFGIALYLTRAGAERLVGWAAAAVALASQPVQMAVLTIRGDGLPAALTVLGLAGCLGARVSMAAPVLFVLAFAAKPTSLYGPAAAVLALTLAGRRQEAVRLGLSVALGAVATLGVMWWASDDRLFEIFAASASGGASWTSLILAPRSLARILGRTPDVIVIVVTAATLLVATRRQTIGLAVHASVLCLLATLAIYASPATVENHLIDLTVMAVLMIGTIATTGPTRPWALAALAVTGVVALAAGSARFMTEDGRDRRQSRLATLATIADARRPVFFEQPMLAAEAGESSYWLDPYMVVVRAQREPSVLQRFLDDIDRRAFGAIVLEQESPDLWFTELRPESAHALREAITRRYMLQAIVEGRAVYRPR